MTRTGTAFKHPRCGGVIYLVEENGRVYFQCDLCSKQADEVEVLAIGKPVIVRHRRQKPARPPRPTFD